MNIPRILVGLSAVGAAAVYSNTGPFDDKTERDQSGEVVEAGGVGTFALRLGDCIQIPEGTGLVVSVVVSVEAVPCGTPHDAQVYAEYNITSVVEYDRGDVELLAQQGCIQRWTEAIGTEFWEDPLLDSFSYFPSPTSWAVGDREVKCLLVSIDLSPLSGSRLLDNS